MNQVDELSESDKDDKQLYEYSRWIEEPTLKDYEKRKRMAEYDEIQENKEKFPLNYSKLPIVVEE